MSETTSPKVSAASSPFNLPPGFLAISATTLCVVVGAGLLPPALPLFIAEWQLSTTEASLLLSAFAAGRIPVALPTGRAADRYGFKPVSGAGLGVAILSALLAIVGGHYSILLLSVFLMGIGAGIFTTTSNAAVITLSDRHTVGRLNSIYQGVILAGLTISPILGGLAALYGGLKGPFVLYLSILGMATFMLHSASRHFGSATRRLASRADARSVAKRLLGERAFRYMMLGSVVVFAALASLRNTLLPIYASEVAGMQEVDLGWMLTASALANILVLFPAGKAVDSLGRRPVLVFGLIAMGASAAFLGGVKVAIWLIIGAAILGAAKGIAAAPLPALVADFAPAGMEAEVVGYYRIAVSLGLFVGPVVLGAVTDGYGFTVAFFGAGAFLALVGVLFMQMPETRPVAPLSPGTEEHYDL